MGTELIAFDQNEIEIIKTNIAKGATDNQLKLFIQVCRQTGLNPFARQIYAVIRNTKKKEKVNGQWIEKWEPEMSIQTSIDGFRLQAQRSEEYAGQDGPYYLDAKTKEWTDYWIEDYPPAAARVGVLRKGFQKYLYAVAKFESYAAHGYNKLTEKYDGELTNLWKKMPEVMIAKVAEALALRRAFPAELSGLYTKEEMDQADMPLPTPEPERKSSHVRIVPEQQEPVQTEEQAKPVEGEVVQETSQEAPPVSVLRARVAEIKVSSNGSILTFEQFYQGVTKLEYVSDDAISPEACQRINRQLDGIVKTRANRQQAS